MGGWGEFKIKKFQKRNNIFEKTKINWWKLKKKEKFERAKSKK